jgi:hypothetical protein
LHRFFREIHMSRAKEPREVRHHAARLVPEQVLQQGPGAG